MNTHVLKTWQEYMHDINTGSKSFELRKDDREFEVGDVLMLMGWDNQFQKYTGDVIEAKINYILSGGQFGLEKGYVVMSITVTKQIESL